MIHSLSHETEFAILGLESIGEKVCDLCIYLK